MGKQLNKFVFCLAVCLSMPAFAESRKFWVWDLNVMPPGARLTSATLRAEGKRSLIFVEDALWEKNITESFVNRLSQRLEQKAPANAYLPNRGVVELLEEIFAPLPTKINPDPRLIILFADLGQYKDFLFDGFFNAFDQMKEIESWTKYQQHSNEGNIVYLNGFRQSETYTEAVIAHETQHLLAHHASGNPNFQQSAWVSEMLGEGAMLLSGYYTDQGHVDRYLMDPAAYSLVSNSYVQYGPQLLFSAFLIDTLKRAGGLGFITRGNLVGKEAITEVYRARSGGAALNFDAIYSLFVSYIFESINNNAKLPSSWQLTGDAGIKLNGVHTYGKLAIPGQTEGELVPYSFAPYELEKDLPASANVLIEVTQGTGTCAEGKGSVFWKPLTPRSIAVYSIGCEQESKKDKLHFHLTIQEQPAISPNATIPFFAR